MRHRIAGRKLGRKSSHRRMMFRHMAASLIEHGKIRTTLPKAKELRRVAERLVTLGKSNTVRARRRAFDFIRNRRAVQKLFGEVAPAFENRAGGYTRIYRLGTRAGDAAGMAIIEFLHEDLLSARVAGKVVEKKKKSQPKKAAATKEKKRDKKDKKDKKEKRGAK